MVILKPVIDEIKDSSVVKSWLKDLSHNSRINYMEALAEFCLINKLKPDEMLNQIYQEEEQRLPAWERSINKWFEAFDEHCKNLKRAKSTRNIRRTIVNAFIGYHGLPQYKPRGTRRKVENLKESQLRENLTKEDLLALLEVCKTFKMRAIILSQASSGLAVADILKLKIKDYQEGLIEIYDENTDKNIKICKLSLERVKTGVKFTTFLNKEAVDAVEKYLNFERTKPQEDDALFSSYKTVGTHMTTVAIQDAYRNLNDYLGWTDRERGSFRKATSHMMRKFFNTQLINAGMPEEIREHMMGHKLKDKVREAYFLADPKELQNNYLRYMEHVSVKGSAIKYSMDEFRELQRQNNKLCDIVAEMKKELKELKGEA